MIPNQMLGMLQQIKANPLQFIMQSRMNIPQNIPMNDPNAILNYLVSTGQVSQQRIDSAYQMAQRLR